MSISTLCSPLSSSAFRGAVDPVAGCRLLVYDPLLGDVICSPAAHCVPTVAVRLLLSARRARARCSALIGVSSAVGRAGRPTWYLWEDSAFWILTGPWTRLCSRIRADPAVALVVDECDPATGIVRQVIVHGNGILLPFDVPRGRRKLGRYLGTDESRWDNRFQRYLYDDPADRGTVWLRVPATLLRAKDLSYSA